MSDIPMNFSQFAELVALLDKSGNMKRVAVAVESPSPSLSPIMSSLVTGVQQGIDWDNGTLFLHTSEKVTRLTSDEVMEIRRARKAGLNWAMYQATNRWEHERNNLIDAINKLRTTLLQRGMSTEELDALAGSLPRKHGDPL